MFAELTSLPVIAHADGSFTVTNKFIEGMNYYAANWDGPVAAVMNPTNDLTDNLDNVRVRPNEIAFEIKAIPFRSAELRSLASQAAFIHWGPHFLTHDLVNTLQESRVTNVYCTEYSLQTRMDIISCETNNRLRRWRRYFWERSQEQMIKRSISACSGFEANGTPTYDSYARLNPKNLLFFASWVKESSLITESTLRKRIAHLNNEKTCLRLVYSGRLNKMKGVMDLLAVAGHLRRKGLNFKLSICGGGVLENVMKERIEQDGLHEHVVMMGVLPFERELIPLLKNGADLFLCCHKQGDPSSTYLETFSCGVPVAGYGNEALTGLLKHADVGWSVPDNSPEGLADVIMALDRNRPDLAKKSFSALYFARRHTFEQTFARRMAFFKEVAEQNQSIQRMRA
jgi:glycosyltransferase involved in cell wall biosynthesis